MHPYHVSVSISNWTEPSMKSNKKTKAIQSSHKVMPKTSPGNQKNRDAPSESTVSHLSVCVCVSVCLSLCLSLSILFFLCLSLCVSVSLCVSLSVSVSICLFSLCVYLCVCLSLFVILSVAVSLYTCGVCRSGHSGRRSAGCFVALAISHRHHCVRFSTAAIDPNVFGITIFLLFMRCVSLWAQQASTGMTFCRISCLASMSLCAV